MELNSRALPYWWLYVEFYEMCGLVYERYMYSSGNKHWKLDFFSVRRSALTLELLELREKKICNEKREALSWAKGTVDY